MIRLRGFGRHQCSTHRSGWPFVHNELERLIVGQGPFVEDFIEANHVYAARTAVPTTEKWVGIMHHPAKIESPLKDDRNHQARRCLSMRPSFRKSMPTLCGVVCLSDELANLVRQWLPKRIRVLSLLHPTDLNVEQWSFEKWEANRRRVHQLGFFLRDTRAMYRTNIKQELHHLSLSSTFHIQWATRRDAKLRQPNRERADAIEQVPRLDAADYDKLLASSVIANHIFGASANNVVIECIARATPLIVNPLPPVVQYLGPTYPLYALRPEQWHEVLTADRVREAHEYLKNRQQFIDLSIGSFANHLDSFANWCCP